MTKSNTNRRNIPMDNDQSKESADIHDKQTQNGGFTQRCENGNNQHRGQGNRGRYQRGRPFRGRKQVACGFLNTNGWPRDHDSDKYDFLMSCIKHYNLHVVGMAETHLIGNRVVGVEGYQWFGLNRRQIHVRAKTRSGGVGLLVRNDFTDQFNVRVVDDTTDGILWVEFEDKTCNHVAFYVCVIYLPPENSTKAVNVHEFLDTLMTQVYTIPHGNPFFLCADWNSRRSDFVDFIPGIDLLRERQTVDYQYNMYGKLFTDFLVDINCCILNGRNTEYNDFTYISTRGSSVVDYCVVPYETLNCYEKFHVHRTSSMIEETGNKGRYDQSRIMPDHSLLTWNFVLNSNYEYKGVENPIQKEFIKYDVQNIPYDWLKSESAVYELN